MLSIFTSINRAIQHARLDAENERLRRIQEYRLPNLKKGVGEAVFKRKERKRRAAEKLVEAEHSATSQTAPEDSEEDNMAGRYMPPHLRNKENLKSGNDMPTKPEDELYSLNEIVSHLGPTVGKPSTLNASASNPEALAFILVFGVVDHHPKYHTHGEIFCKSNLSLLSAPADTTTKNDESAATPNEGQEIIIPVFEQHGRQTSHNPSFKSLGWHSVTQTTFLEPRSAELVAMMDIKFRTRKPDGTEVQKTRDAQRWQESLAMRWAVVKLGKVEKSIGKDPMEGCVREQKKGVNELMREMRLAGGGGLEGEVNGGRGLGKRTMGSMGRERAAGGRDGSSSGFEKTIISSYVGGGSTDSFYRGSTGKGAPSDTWSLVSTGPIDKTYTMVHETKDEET